MGQPYTRSMDPLEPDDPRLDAEAAVGIYRVLIDRTFAHLGDGDDVTLRLVRCRHKTLSFRFEPPAPWRARAMPRDGKTYAFRILRATYAGTFIDSG